MAFWMSDETALRDKNLTSQDPKLRQRAVEQVLGGSFRQLTRVRKVLGEVASLRGISLAATEKNDVNTIFQMVLEGMHRGAGLERVAIAFVKGRKLQSKYMIGEPTEHWRDAFLFESFKHFGTQAQLSLNSLSARAGRA